MRPAASSSPGEQGRAGRQAEPGSELGWPGEHPAEGLAHILMGFLGIVALVGFYDVLRDAGKVMELAPILGTVGLTWVTVAHLVPISMAYELVPAYSDAEPAGRASLAATFDTFAAAALVTNSAGNFLGWGGSTRVRGGDSQDAHCPMDRKARHSRRRSSPDGWDC